jgi:glycogen debranching enzyme
LKKRAKGQSAADVIEVDDQFYIRAQSSLADDRTRVLLQGDTFGVFDRFGDIQPLGHGQQGIFHCETRHLSSLQVRISGMRPLLLSSTVRDDNALLAVDLTNPDMTVSGGAPILRGTVHILRTKFLTDAACFDRFVVHNYGPDPIALELTLAFSADFADIFEVRGQKRERRGVRRPTQVEGSKTVLTYEGLDGVERRTRIECSAPCGVISEAAIVVPIQLKSHEETVFYAYVFCESEGQTAPQLSYEASLQALDRTRQASPVAAIDIYTSNEQFNDWTTRSRADLDMMIAATPFGPYPYAGVPWFSTVFGRDGIIAAFELLWLAPSVAKGVLSFLSATQSNERDPTRDAEPGKILHEMRKGEMARLGEVPFGRYYGSVDVTPLYIFLAAQYYQRTGDLEFVRAIWPNIEAALDWIDQYGDADGDGFVEYARLASSGLLHQGWKDSHDSVFHRDGEPATGPIALCEVQAYVYAAKRQIADAAADLGLPARSEALRDQAGQLRERFQRAFWSEELSMFAMALDGDKRPCLVRSSNAGQCLFSGIATAAQFRQSIEALTAPRLFSGWGIRTIATDEKRYNPMSYHNGSVWPHDNALIAYGFAEARNKRPAMRILESLLDLSVFAELHRLPELICGFERGPGTGPTLYPVACSPQAWAAGAVYLVLQSCLGLSISAKESRIYLNHTALPEALPHVRVRNLQVGGGSVDFAVRRHAQAVAVEVLRRTGDVEIVTLK